MATSHNYRFDLRKLKPNAPRQVVADYGASLAEPLKVEKAGTTPGLGRINSLLVIGDWSDKPVDVVLSKIALAPPTGAIRAERAKLRAIKAKEAEQARLEAELKAKARKKLLTEGARTLRTARKCGTSAPSRRTSSPSPCRPDNMSAINSYTTLPNRATKLWSRKRTSRFTR